MRGEKKVLSRCSVWPPHTTALRTNRAERGRFGKCMVILPHARAVLYQLSESVGKHANIVTGKCQRYQWHAKAKSIAPYYGTEIRGAFTNCTDPDCVPLTTSDRNIPKNLLRRSIYWNLPFAGGCQEDRLSTPARPERVFLTSGLLLTFKADPLRFAYISGL
ncbi:hypothetical protein OG21DRAFT_338571 [Imleria badia]|nr:hypothetical protein OG21DRAFT_338571 [Imleria badia]